MNTIIILAALVAGFAAVIFYVRKHPAAIAQLRADFAAHAATVSQRVDDLTRQPITVNVSAAPTPAPIAATAIFSPLAREAAPVVVDEVTAAPAGTPLGNLDPNDMTRRMLEGEDAGMPAATPISAAPAGPVVDMWRGAFDFGLGEQFWKGGAGDVSAFPVPVPAGWRGTLEVMAGESSQAGVKVDQMDVWFSTMPKQSGPANWPRFDRGPYADIALHIDQDVGLIYVNVHQWQPGGGFVKLNPLAA